MKKNSDGGEFAGQVASVYKAALANEPRPDVGPDARRVGFGLVAFRQMIDHFLHVHRKDPTLLAGAGVYEAEDIVAAMTDGTAHPLWRYLESLRSSEELHNRPAPAERERTIRAMLAGAALAYEKTGTKKAAAVEAVSAGIRTAERSFTADQIKNWIKDNRGRAEWFAGQFTADSKLIPDRYDARERILIALREAIHPLLAVPK